MLENNMLTILLAIYVDIYIILEKIYIYKIVTARKPFLSCPKRQKPSFSNNWPRSSSLQPLFPSLVTEGQWI